MRPPPGGGVGTWGSGSSFSGPKTRGPFASLDLSILTCKMMPVLGRWDTWPPNIPKYTSHLRQEVGHPRLQLPSSTVRNVPLTDQSPELLLPDRSAVSSPPLSWGPHPRLPLDPRPRPVPPGPLAPGKPETAVFHGGASWPLLRGSVCTWPSPHHSCATVSRLYLLLLFLSSPLKQWLFPGFCP